MSYVSEIRKIVGHIPLQLPGSGIIVHRDNKEFLLQLRSDHNNYGLLGGGMENGEDFKECAIRELQEEACILANRNDLMLCDVYAGKNHRTVHPNQDIVYHIVVVYKLEYKKCTQLSGQYDSETKALKWFNIEELENLLYQGMIFPNNIPIIRDVLDGRF